MFHHVHITPGLAVSTEWIDVMWMRGILLTTKEFRRQHWLHNTEWQRQRGRYRHLRGRRRRQRRRRQQRRRSLCWHISQFHKCLKQSCAHFEGSYGYEALYIDVHVIHRYMRSVCKLDHTPNSGEWAAIKRFEIQSETRFKCGRVSRGCVDGADGRVSFEHHIVGDFSWAFTKTHITCTCQQSMHNVIWYGLTVPAQYH